MNRIMVVIFGALLAPFFVSGVYAHTVEEQISGAVAPLQTEITAQQQYNLNQDARMDGIEARLDALESQPAPEPDPIPELDPVPIPDPEPEPGPVNSASFDKTLFDCVDELRNSGNVRCEMRVSDEHPSITAVEHPDGYPGFIRGNSGIGGMITRWNSLTIDRENYRMVARGGGHNGNHGTDHVTFHLAEGKITRDSEPDPLEYWFESHREENRFCPSPNIYEIPAASHGWDSPHRDSASGLTLVFSRTQFKNAYCKWGDEVEIDPDKLLPQVDQEGLYLCNYNQAVTKGLESGQCRKIDSTPYGFPFAANHPDGGVIFGGSFTKTHYGRITETGIGIDEDWGPAITGIGPVSYSKWTDSFWYAQESKIVEVSTDGVQRNRWNTRDPSKSSMHPYKDGSLVGWDGRSWVFRFEKGEWSFYNLGAEGLLCERGTQMYSKFPYLDDLDVHVGICDETQGISVFDLSKVEWTPLSTKTLQDTIDEAPSGQVLKVPTAVYRYGSFVNHALSLDMEGVDILRPAGARAFLEVNAYPSVIDNFTIRYAPDCGSNCGAIRYTGILDAEIRNFHFENQEMAVMSGHEGGSLLMDTGTIIAQSPGRINSTLMHNIYINDIDEFTFNYGTIIGQASKGHVAKASARIININYSVFDGADSTHSRVFDFPRCGIRNITGSTFIQSPNAVNAELLSFGVEGCDTADVYLKDNTFIGARPDARFGKLGANVTLHDLGGNVFQGLESPF